MTSVVDEVVTLPVRERAVAVAGLLVVVGRAARLVAAQVALDVLVVILLGLRRFAQAAQQARFVIDVLFLAAAVDIEGHLAVALVRARDRFFLRRIDR